VSYYTSTSIQVGFCISHKVLGPVYLFHSVIDENINFSDGKFKAVFSFTPM
jgi:surface polysaccharide O-acyltransferase-like enzyme